MRRLIAVLAASIALSTTATAQVAVGSPAWVVEMFYAHRTFPEKAQHLTGEFAAHYASSPTMGSRLPSSVVVTSRALLLQRDRAIYATSLRDASHAQDWYTYLRQEGGVWKIEAVRTLSFPPIHALLLDSLDAKRRRGELADSIVSVMETMRLSVRSDSALRRHVADHQSALRALAERFAAVRGLNAVSIDGESSPATAVSSTEQRALVAGLREQRLGALMRFPERPRCIFMKIGGASDNSVGFIYAPAGCTPPPMSPTQYIYVEAAAPGWFVYKTT